MAEIRSQTVKICEKVQKFHRMRIRKIKNTRIFQIVSTEKFLRDQNNVWVHSLHRGFWVYI